MKRFLSALLCAVLFLGLLPAVSPPARMITDADCFVNKTTAYVGDTLTWSVENEDGIGSRYAYSYNVWRNGSEYLHDGIFHDDENHRSFRAPEPGIYYPVVIILDYGAVGSGQNYVPFQGPYTAVSLRPASKISEVEAISGTSLKIAWNAIPDASGYFLERSASKTTGFKLVKTTAATGFTDTSLKPGTRYYYRVRSYNVIDGVKWPSGKYSDAIAGVPLAKPAITTSCVSTSQIRLTWEKVAGATGYQVFRSAYKSGTYTAIRKISALSMIVTGMEPGKTYYFKVRAYKNIYTKTYYGPMSGYRSGLTLAEPTQN